MTPSDPIGSGTQFGTWSDFVTGAQTQTIENLIIQNNSFGQFLFNIYTNNAVSTFEQSLLYYAGHFTTAANSLGSFPQSQSALTDLKNSLNSLGHGFGAASTVLGVGGEVFSNVTYALDPTNHAQGAMHFEHEMAGHLFGTTGNLLGGLTGDLLAGEVIGAMGLAGGVTLGLTIGIPLVAGLLGGAALRGLFNWALPEHVSTAPGNAVGPNSVGGVLFAEAAVATNVLPEISGAYWNGKRGSLVLVGPDDTQTFLPVSTNTVERDHLVIALRAALTGANMGVSIDPPSKYREGLQSGNFPPDPTDMYVSYLGNTSGTLCGAIMFEADRLMKCLSNGADNLNGRRPLSAHVSGYRNMLELFNTIEAGKSGAWFRFWFVIESVEIGYNAAAEALRFGDVRIKVLNETELPGGRKAPKSRACDAFTDHLTKHYDDYASDFPVLVRLKTVAKITALARFLVKLGISIDPQFVFSYRAFDVSTPESTPGIRVASSGIALFGGVKMSSDVALLSRKADPPLALADWSAPDGGLPSDYTEDVEACAMRAAAEGTRLGDFTTVWRSGRTGQRERAMALQLGSIPRPKRVGSSSDHTFVPSWEGSLRSIRRHYDSSNPSGDFGQAWLLHSGYRLEVIMPTDKREEVRLSSERNGNVYPLCLALHDLSADRTMVLRRHKAMDSAEGLAYCPTRLSGAKNGRIDYIIEDGPVIRWTRAGFILRVAAHLYRFDPHGHITEIREHGNLLVRYEWVGGLLAKIDCGGGRFYEIHYDAGQLAGPRITRINASDGRVLRYAYDHSVMLESCTVDGKKKSSYRYDSHSKLSEVRAGNGDVVVRSSYDAVGNQLPASGGLFRLSDGSTIVRIATGSGRTESVQDSIGRAKFSYRENGSLASVTGRSAGGKFWSLRYDDSGRLVGANDSFGAKTSLSYGDNSSLKKASDASGRSLEFSTDGSGTRTTRRDANVTRWSALFDTHGLLQSLTTSDGAYGFKYKKGELQSIVAVGRRCKIKRGGHAIAISSQLPDRVKRHMTVDLISGATTVMTKGRGRAVRQISFDREVLHIEDCAGGATYRAGKDSSTLEVTFEAPDRAASRKRREFFPDISFGT